MKKKSNCSDQVHAFTAWTVRKRWKRVLGYGILVICAGLLYAVFVKWSGIAIPCLFHLVTGLKCPGCGVTQMCVALLH